jgi:hypothetical protein
MTELRVTIRGDGSSDAMLRPVVDWVLGRHLPAGTPIEVQHARLTGVPSGQRKQLAGSVESALRLAPCDLLVVHRDAEKENPAKRRQEIEDALTELQSAGVPVPGHIKLIPVRTSEAWLLFDESAIRAASGNPNGKVKLKLPAPKAVEGLPDPKAMLRELVKAASEATGRRLQKLDTSNIPRTVAENIDDFSPLRKLSAFRAFESEVREFAESWRPDD